jgi:hypothetical protein
MSVARYSQAYHETSLAFARATIVEMAAKGQPILELLRAYTADVVRAEDDRNEGSVGAERTRILEVAHKVLAAADYNALVKTLAGWPAPDRGVTP